MDDDIYFIPDTISIMSKLGEPPPPNNQEDSLSKIIREQALHYDEENLNGYLSGGGGRFQGKMPKSDRRDKVYREATSNPEIRGSTLQEWNAQKQTKNIPSHQKLQKRRKDPTANSANICSIQRKGNVMLFDDQLPQQQVMAHSKKQKREGRARLDEQKTTKNEFHDIGRYKKEPKRYDLTRIRHNDDPYDIEGDNLGLSSKENSETLMDSRDLGILTHRVISNYNLLVAQVKEQMAFIRCQHIEAEKIELRRMISKLEADIRRIRIGFRGASDSLGKGAGGFDASKLKQDSRLRTEGEGEGSCLRIRRREGEGNKIESKVRKNNSPQNITRLAYDYGGDNKCLDAVQQYPPLEKMQKLQDELRKERVRYNKFTSKLAELQKKFNNLRTDKMKKAESQLRRTENQNGGASIIKRSHLLKEKIVFLKNQVKETKVFYSNKIKRLKNENTILKNENHYISKEMEQSRQNHQRNKKMSQQLAGKNLMIFDEVESSKATYNVIDSQSKVISTFIKDCTSGLGTINDVKSLQSINSAKSITLFHSKPSLGSINSYKSTKIQSVQKKKPLQNQKPIKNKLKIKASQNLSPPSLGEMKQNSFLKRFNPVQRDSLGVNLSKKSTSLDVAIKQLQEKYSKHLQSKFNEDQYYQDYK